MEQYYLVTKGTTQRIHEKCGTPIVFSKEVVESERGVWEDILDRDLDIVSVDWWFRTHGKARGIATAFAKWLTEQNGGVIMEGHEQNIVEEWIREARQ